MPKDISMVLKGWANMSYIDNIHTPDEIVDSWQTAMQYLEDGNRRYVDNVTEARNIDDQDRKTYSEGQYPFAAVVTCSDSRTAPEIFFDQSMGDIFVIRNAGNITDTTVIASIEYAVEYLHTPLVVVIGHSLCGAVASAYYGGEFSGKLQCIVGKIRRAIAGSSSLENAICTNVDHVVNEIKRYKSVREQDVAVFGAYYDIRSGEVSWLEN